MLTITIPETELYDEIRNEIVFVKEQKLVLEHSLVSLSKWESKWHKPFIGNTTMTNEETVDYIRCMTVNPIDPNAYKCLSSEHMIRIKDYIEDPMTATTIKESQKKGKHEIVTAEIIYYWMVAMNIPFECQKWHLNKLLTLINVVNIKNQPKKKMNPKAVASRNASLNAARRKALHTRG